MFLSTQEKNTIVFFLEYYCDYHDFEILKYENNSNKIGETIRTKDRPTGERTDQWRTIEDI